MPKSAMRRADATYGGALRQSDANCNCYCYRDSYSYCYSPTHANAKI